MYLSFIQPYLWCTGYNAVFTPVDDLLSSNEKPPGGNKEVTISVSVQKDSDSESCPSKTTSNQSSPLIIRGEREGREAGLTKQESLYC